MVIEIIKMQVRRRKSTQELEGYYMEPGPYGDRQMTSFNFSEGHNRTCKEYKEILTAPVSKEEAIKFCTRVENYYNSLPDITCKIVPVQRLTY